MVNRRTGARFAVGGHQGCRQGRLRWRREPGRVSPPGPRPRAGGGRYLGYRPLVVVGLLLLGAAAAVALVLVRKGRRGGDPGPEDAAPPVPPSASGPAPPAAQEGPAAGVEERVRDRVGGDPRTRDLPAVSIGVDDGMAWIDGSVPSQEAKEALTEVVGAVDGVNIVVNRVAVGGA